jgi:hypothetical protein
MTIIPIDVTTHTGYNVASALRGPDGSGDIVRAIKALLTALLRKSTTCNVNLRLKEWRTQPHCWHDGIRHCLAHLAIAFNALSYGHIYSNVPPTIQAEATALDAYACACSRVLRLARRLPGEILEDPRYLDAHQATVDAALHRYNSLVTHGR